MVSCISFNSIKNSQLNDWQATINYIHITYFVL